MRRKLFTLAAAVSLVLCVLAVVLWVRSYWVLDSLIYVLPDGWASIKSRRGSVGVERFRNNLRDEFPDHYEQYKGIRYSRRNLRYAGVKDVGYASDSGVRHHWYGCGYLCLVLDGAGTPESLAGWDVAAPHRLLILLLALAPARWVARHRHRRTQHRLKAGLCTSCGYDLRATPGRCPECGTPVNDANDPGEGDT